MSTTFYCTPLLCRHVSNLVCQLSTIHSCQHVLNLLPTFYQHPCRQLSINIGVGNFLPTLVSATFYQHLYQQLSTTHSCHHVLNLLCQLSTTHPNAKCLDLTCQLSTTHSCRHVSNLPCQLCMTHPYRHVLNLVCQLFTNILLSIQQIKSTASFLLTPLSSMWTVSSRASRVKNSRTDNNLGPSLPKPSSLGHDRKQNEMRRS